MDAASGDMKRQSNNIPQQAFCRSSAVVLPAMKFVQKELFLPGPDGDIKKGNPRGLPENR